MTGLLTHVQAETWTFSPPKNKEKGPRSSCWSPSIPVLCSQQLYIQLQSFYKWTRYFPPWACCWNRILNKWSVPAGCQRDLHVTHGAVWVFHCDFSPGPSELINLTYSWEKLSSISPGKKVCSLAHLHNKYYLLISSAHLGNTILPKNCTW